MTEHMLILSLKSRPHSFNVICFNVCIACSCPSLIASILLRAQKICRLQLAHTQAYGLLLQMKTYRYKF